jgi:hypothetical protein
MRQYLLKTNQLNDIALFILLYRQYHAGLNINEAGLPLSLWPLGGLRALG